ncbi:hypothetical protein [Nitratireductor sp.]|uniref:hypothetical protein n=1 Tax=Nitratireductor sp. TaxID=1872084 RepID=UPI002637F088|nr:hypothetical protein [Nitratireductor sp.]MCV0381729.1 hypothetical protein [Nitratireductor sp.]
MTTPGTRVSTQADFPKLAVYERSGPHGKIASIVFTNTESNEGWRSELVALVAIVGIIIFFAGVFSLPQIAPGGVVAAWWIFAGTGLIVFIWKFGRPRKIERTIELDFGADTIRVLRNGKPEIQRQLSRLANLTLDVHPEAEYYREKRLQKGEKALTLREREHCLFGWFGAGGAERVLLVSRLEWPSQQSLFEVRQAILWAIQRAAGPGAPDIVNEPQPTRSGGLNPPLE